jgi:probable phosphoglycerate mutase
MGLARHVPRLGRPSLRRRGESGAQKGEDSVRELVLIRHGVTGWNQGRILQGNQNVPLSEEGHRQSICLARFLTTLPRPDVLCSSDLERAKQTAWHVAEALGMTVTLMPALRERSYGIYEGRAWAEVRAELEAGIRASGDPEGYAPPKGESIRQVKARLRGALAHLEATWPQGIVWVVSHGGSIRGLLRTLVPGEAEKMVDGYQIPNTGVSMLRREGDRWTLEVLNSTRHLEGEVGVTVTRSFVDEAQAVERASSAC